MAIEGKVRTLYTDKTQQEAIFPTTKVSAVTDDEGNGLNTLLEHIAYVDPMDMESAAVLANADTLGGYPASDYAFVEDLKNLKPEEIGAAPAGFGLGDMVDCNTFDGTIKTGFYSMMGDQCLDRPEVFPLFRFGMMRVENRWEIMIKQTMYYYGTYNGVAYAVTAVRSSADGGKTWGELEFINPPMELGTEYRTTERYLGKAVYMQLVDCGNLPNNSQKNVTFPNTTTYDKIISVSCYAYSPTVGGFNLPYRDSAGTSNAGYVLAGSYIRLFTSFDASSMACKALIKYTKD